jgi:flagella basal body P-ring formation protein FlgA
MLAKRSLAPGDLLNRNWVTGVCLVRNGEMVRLLVQNGSISISVLARALQDGKLGDRIKVRNIESDRALTAVVIGRGEVRISH